MTTVNEQLENLFSLARTPNEPMVDHGAHLVKVVDVAAQNVNVVLQRAQRKRTLRLLSAEIWTDGKKLRCVGQFSNTDGKRSYSGRETLEDPRDVLEINGFVALEIPEESVAKDSSTGTDETSYPHHGYFNSDFETLEQDWSAEAVLTPSELSRLGV